MKKPIVRQGDVLLERVNAAIPAGSILQPRITGRVILALGEVTGHAHTIAASGAELYEAQDGTHYLLIREGPAFLTHEEHGGILLDAGVYRVVRQQEYHPEEIRRVED